MLATVHSIEDGDADIEVFDFRLYVRWEGPPPKAKAAVSGANKEIVACLDSVDENGIGSIVFGQGRMDVDLVGEGFSVGNVYKFTFSEIKAYDMNL